MQEEHKTRTKKKKIQQFHDWVYMKSLASHDLDINLWSGMAFIYRIKFNEKQKINILNPYQK